MKTSNELKDRCRGCAERAVRPFFDLGPLPLAGGFLNEAQIASEQRYPLLVSVCENCGLVQIVSPVDPDVLFQDYSFATGTIPGLVRHFEDYAEWISQNFQPKSVIEFGCNDGTLIAALEKHSIRSVGVDLAANITEMARQQGRNVVTGSFGPQIVDQLRDEMGQVDLITGSNVFAHNADPESILEAVERALGSRRRALPRGDVRRRPSAPTPVGHPLPRTSHLLLPRDTGQGLAALWVRTRLGYSHPDARWLSATRCRTIESAAS